MSKIPSVEELFKAGVHFGHKSSKWHPKMKPFIFTTKNKLHIINLEETHKALEQAYTFVKDTVAKGGLVLFLGTKKQAQLITKEAALSCKMPYITERWLGGTLTNSKSVFGLVKSYKRMKTERDLGKLDRYTKKERLMIERKIEKLNPLIGGIEGLNKMPDAIFIVDIKKEKTALTEANKMKIPVVAICDTNVNPEKTNYSIPGNDDAIKSIKILVHTIVAAVLEGQAHPTVTEKRVDFKSSTVSAPAKKLEPKADVK